MSNTHESNRSIHNQWIASTLRLEHSGYVQLDRLVGQREESEQSMFYEQIAALEAAGIPYEVVYLEPGKSDLALYIKAESKPTR